jgi:HSF-type DNA-binding
MVLQEVLQHALWDPELADIVSWDPSGMAFEVHNPKLFETEILPKYFPTIQSYAAFRRQLTLYGFNDHMSQYHSMGHYLFPTVSNHSRNEGMSVTVLLRVSVLYWS